MLKIIKDITVRLFWLILITGVTYTQQIANTKDGKAVVLFEDGTWQYLEKNSTPKQVQTNETQIFITKSGKKYHLDGCRWLKSRIPSTISEAVSKGLTPCKVCQPPSANSNYSVPTPIYTPKANTSSGRCQAITQKGTQCKRKSQSGRNYCWQHP